MSLRRKSVKQMYLCLHTRRSWCPTARKCSRWVTLSPFRPHLPLDSCRVSWVLRWCWTSCPRVWAGQTQSRFPTNLYPEKHEKQNDYIKWIWMYTYLVTGVETLERVAQVTFGAGTSQERGVLFAGRLGTIPRPQQSGGHLESEGVGVRPPRTFHGEGDVRQGHGIVTNSNIGTGVTARLKRGNISWIHVAYGTISIRLHNNTIYHLFLVIKQQLVMKM